MSLSTMRETSAITLVDYTSFTLWIQALESRCLSLEIWDIIDPSGTATPQKKPTIPIAPEIAEY
ncbi:hypothetical protein EJ07DRAFT_107073, partial [Lizonia empirigonia]